MTISASVIQTKKQAIVHKIGAPGLEGEPGASAYAVAVASGFTGTEAEWLASLVGPQGIKGDKGEKGDPGIQGPKGDTGPQGDRGLQGEQGVKGDKGDTGEQGPQGAQGVQGPKGDTGATGAQGIQGIQGPKGDTGNTGPIGADGLSAYQVAVANGFVGTLSQWLASLKGDKGDTGATGSTGAAGQGVPVGGTAGQVLSKKSASDYDTEWQTPSSGGGTADMGQVILASQIYGG